MRLWATDTVISLDNRLKTAAAMVRQAVTVCDVGTDHALLACHLAMNGAKEVIASDINDGPLESARRTVEQYGVKNVRVLKSDGLKQIDFADDVIIAGMGGELIADIIAGCRFVTEDTHFILQPMTKAEVLRTRLYADGFEILEERTAYDGKRAYVIILAAYTGEKMDIDEVTAYTGRVTDPKFLRLTAEKLMKNARGMEASESYGSEAERLRALAEKILKKAEELS
ncbi:MAG: SAM-dependent methyltransferase [Oscillospiraceae bacterium]|nr:SAM-dependent methyltransferase [Oscillospiraceae bacterium]